MLNVQKQFWRQLARSVRPALAASRAPVRADRRAGRRQAIEVWRAPLARPTSVRASSRRHPFDTLRAPLGGISSPFGGGRWTPKKLFAASEVGVWFDPSDLSTMFQDAAGTTPVTAVEQPVGLHLDKSKGLALGTDLVTNGDSEAGAITIAPEGLQNVTKASVASPSGSGNATAYTSNSAGSVTHQVNHSSSTMAAGVWYKITGRAYVPTGGIANFRLYDNSDGSWFSSSMTTKDQWVSFTYYRQKATAWTLGFGNNNLEVVSSGSVAFYVDDLSIRPISGNHRYQSTSAARPTLSARYNLFTKSEDLSDVVWTTLYAVGGSRTNGAFSFSDSEGYVYVGQNVPVVVTNYTVSFEATCDQAISNVPFRVVVNAGTAGTQLVTFSAGETKRISITADCPGATTATVQIGIDARNAILPGGSNATGYVVTLNKIDIRPTNDGVGLPAYQRVNTSTDYDTSGFPMYLRYDGTDDFMQTAAVDFSATDAMSLFAGIRPLAPATSGIVCELSQLVNSNDGSFYLFAFNSGNTYYGVRGSAFVQTFGTTHSTAQTFVVTCLSDISADTLVIRENSAQTGTTSSDQGTGNFGNYAIYFGARAGTSLFFNGREYQTIIRGAASTAAEIASTETYVNVRTKAY